MFQLKEVVAGVKSAAKRAAVGVTMAGASVAAFAQSSGTSGSSTTFDTTAIVSSINGVIPALVAVGAATLAVVTVAWGIKMVRTFLGR